MVVAVAAAVALVAAAAETLLDVVSPGGAKCHHHWYQDAWLCQGRLLGLEIELRVTGLMFIYEVKFELP